MKVVFFLQFLIEIFLKKKSIICRVFKGKKKERWKKKVDLFIY